MILQKSLSILRDWVTSAQNQNQRVVLCFSPSYCRPNFLWIGDYCRGASRDYRAVHRFTQGRWAKLFLLTGWCEVAYCSGNHGLPVWVIRQPPDQFASLVVSESWHIATRLLFVRLPKRCNIPVASDNHRRIEKENNLGNLRNYTSPAL